MTGEVTQDSDVAAYTDLVVTFRDGMIISDVRNRETQPLAVPTMAPATPLKQRSQVWTVWAIAMSAAARALERNKTRAALTMLGIFIGVACCCNCWRRSGLFHLSLPQFA